MDDECVAELGRPISGMKVAELRDELTRRSLIKTGNKKELIDRLRTAIKRQSSQNAGATDLTIQSASHQLAQHEQPADLSQPEDDEEAEDAEGKRQQLINQQQQQPLDFNRSSSIAQHDGAASPIVTPDAPHQQSNDPATIDQPQDLAIKLTQPNSTESEQTEKCLLQNTLPQVEVTQKQQQTEQGSPQPEPLMLKQQNVDHPQMTPHLHENKPGNSASLKGDDSNDAAIDYSSQDSVETPDQANKKIEEPTPPELKHDGEEKPGEVEMKVTDKPAEYETQTSEKVEADSKESPSGSQSTAPVESEMPSAYVPITLKRGATGEGRNSLEHKEKRRKWSTKTESSHSSETSLHNNLTSVGISSQKLQQLIEVRNAEKLEAEKAAAAKASSSKIGNEKATDVEAKKKKSEPDSKVSNQELSDKTTVKKDKQQIEPGQSEKAFVHEGSKKIDQKPTQEDEQESETSVDPTNILLVQNLVRPFTLSQLKEVLTKYGPMVEEKFWTDKVKSTCCVMFEDQEIAQQTREALNGQQWPSSNPKTLKVTFINEETLTKYMNQEVTKAPEGDNVGGDSQELDENIKTSPQQSASRTITNRLGNKVDDIDEASAGQSVKKRLGDKVAGEMSIKSSNINRASDNSHPQELDDLFKRTESIPHLFWLPLTEDQAEVRRKKRAEKEARELETSRKAPARRVTPPRWRSPPRRSPIRHRSPARRSPLARRRSPARRSPVKRSPARRSSPSRYRSPVRRSPLGQRSPARRRTPPLPRSSPPRRRSPGPIRRSPGPIRRSPTRRSPMLNRRSPMLNRRSPMLNRRSPMLNRRSPMLNRRSPGPIRRSPGPIRRSPGPIRRSPGPIRRSPGPMRRSPGPIRRSPGPIRRSPGPMRRSPGPTRRSPAHVRRSPAPLRGVSPARRSRSRSMSSSRSRSPIRRRSRTPRRKSPIGYGSEPRRAQRFDRIR